MYALQQSSPLYMVKPCVSTVDQSSTPLTEKTIELLASTNSGQCSVIGSDDSVFIVNSGIDTVAMAENHGNMLSKRLNKYYHQNRPPPTVSQSLPK